MNREKKSQIALRTIDSLHQLQQRANEEYAQLVQEHNNQASKEMLRIIGKKLFLITRIAKATTGKGIYDTKHYPFRTRMDEITNEARQQINEKYPFNTIFQ